MMSKKITRNKKKWANFKICTIKVSKFKSLGNKFRALSAYYIMVNKNKIIYGNLYKSTHYYIRTFIY